MKPDLLVHEHTRLQLSNFLNKPAHSLLLTGPPGSGKLHTAMYLSARLMDTSIDKLDSQPYFILMQKPDGKQDIPIDDVRHTIKKLALKTSGRKRIVLIENAHLLSEEAQNALLKNIEEPPDHTHFILTVPAASMLLPTITSRSQKIAIKPVSLNDTVEYFSPDYDQKTISGAWNLSRGSAGLMSALLVDDEQHPLKQAIEQAKQFINQDRYERIIFLDKLGSDKPSYITFLDALDRLLAVLSKAAIQSDKTSQYKRLLKARRLVGSSMDSLLVNASPRLIGLSLAQKLTI